MARTAHAGRRRGETNRALLKMLQIFRGQTSKRACDEFKDDANACIVCAQGAVAERFQTVGGTEIATFSLPDYRYCDQHCLRKKNEDDVGRDLRCINVAIYIQLVVSNQAFLKIKCYTLLRQEDAGIDAASSFLVKAPGAEPDTALTFAVPETHPRLKRHGEIRLQID